MLHNLRRCKGRPAVDADDPPIALNGALGRGSDRERFAATRRLHAPDVLDPASAARLRTALEATTAWERTVFDGGHTLDIPPAELAALSPEGQVALHRSVYETARAGFGYLFETVRISNHVRAGRPVDPAFSALFRFLNSPAFLRPIAELTGDGRGVYVDAQATRYLPGFFLNAHNDHADGRDRLYAYVLNMTPAWQTDWGGLLLFHDEAGNIAEGFAPAFNALNIFAVPQRHSVSLVAPFAGAARLSITGWIRSRAPTGDD